MWDAKENNGIQKGNGENERMQIINKTTRKHSVTGKNVLSVKYDERSVIMLIRCFFLS